MYQPQLNLAIANADYTTAAKCLILEAWRASEVQYVTMHSPEQVRPAL